MEAKELRIGNYILDRGNKMWQIDHWEHSTKVSAKSPFLGYFANSDIEMYGHPFTEDLEFLKPVPITEELLLRFGFSKPNLRPDRDWQNDESDDSYDERVLSKDWDFEFEDLNGTYPYLHEKIDICLNESDGKYYIFERHIYADESSGLDIIYSGITEVHQLQNLYYALTASELQLKK